MEKISLQKRISNFAQKTPDKKAVEWGEKYITYLELEQNSNQIANFLSVHVGENKKIPVIMEQSISLIECLLGIIKSGNIFVPIDPDYPANRIKTMIKEIGSDWMIAQTATLQQIEAAIEDKDNLVNVLLLEPVIYHKEKVKHLNIYQIDRHIEKDSLLKKDVSNTYCYIYFTSGSTGRPKGILGRHRSLDHFIQWEIGEFSVNEAFRVSQLTSPSFDPFLRDVFVPLCAGGTLCIPDSKDIIIDPEKLVSWLEKNQITLVHTVPVLFKNMMSRIETSNRFGDLRYILLAGEILRGNDIRKFIEGFEGRIKLVNLYGPTETTLAKFFYRIRREDINRTTIPVGIPITYTEALILNQDLNKCEVNVPGEIFIRTPFISSGYFNDRELTKEVFIKNPFSSNEQDIIYKTGDIGRMLPDGNIEVMGRIDSQVKIRGSRVETTEVENQLLKHEAVKEAVVKVWEDKNGDKYLCAYVTGNRQLVAKELREYIKRELPEYMIPSYFVQLDGMPLTPNGKIERKVLPEPNGSMETGAEYEAPRNETEEKVAKIWKEVLRLDKVGINDSFFELGGHSLKAANMISKLHKELNFEVPLREIFRVPTIKGLSEYMMVHGENIYAAIEPIEEKEYYGLSSAQKRIYTLQQFDLESTGYNMPRVLEMEGELHVERLENAFRKLIERHEALRTSFELIEEELVQKIHKEVEFEIEFREAREEDVEGIIRSFIRHFDLSKAPLLRVGLISFPIEKQLHPKKHILMYDMHHIISDGTSLGKLTEELVKLYEGQELIPLRIQYKDFSEWQNQLFNSENIKAQEEYWLKQFEGEIPVLNLKADYQRPAVQSFEGASIQFRLEEELTNKLSQIAKDTGSTIYMVLLGALNILLSKYSGQADIIIGTPIAGRPHADLENIIGVFVNTLAMRNYPDENKTLLGFLQEVKENSLKAYENQDYQFEELVDKLNVRRDMSRNPLFDIMFTMQNIDAGTVETVGGLKIYPYKSDSKVAKFDLELTAIENNDTISLIVEYCTKLFKKESIEKLMLHFINILKDISADREKKLSEIEMMDETEKKQVLMDFNSNKEDITLYKPVYRMFEERTHMHPDRTAVRYGDTELSYGQVNIRANRIAHYLRGRGLGKDDLAAIMLERSPLMLESILGIWKAQSAYIPIDIHYPEERICGIFEDSKSKFLITKSSYVNEQMRVEFGQSIIELDMIEELLSREDEANPDIEYDFSALAYVIYTSGSTGKPKGATVEQLGMINHMYSKINTLKLNENSIIVQNASQCFDISVWQFFTALIVGGMTVIYSGDIARNPKDLLDNVIKDNVTILEVVPSFLSAMLDHIEGNREELCHLEYLLITGEIVKPALINRWFEVYPGIKVVNAYGPTEASDDITHYIMDRQIDTDSVPIGKPIQNMNIYIVNNTMNLCPVGIKGEICVAGIGVGRGYLNNEAQTVKAFIEDPFAAEKGIRLYKTGDLGLWLSDGNIEFFGRIDNQVKVRGFRIELGEIENKILQHEDIKEAAVIVRENNKNEKYICAYLVSEKKLDVLNIKGHLKESLPAYMIPAYFVKLDKMPLTANGKLDRRNLPEPDLYTILNEYEAPRNELEEKLVKIWQEILGVDKIGIKDSFFELGGNSINIIRMVSLINNEIGIELKMADLFINKTIEELSEYINEKEFKNRLKSVQMLNKGKSGENVFILHPQHGGIYDYKDLAELLDGDFQVYGIQMKGLDGSCSLAQTMDEMVEDYIKEIKQVQSEGPYIIMGYCTGSIIAYEITRALEKQKEKTGKYICIDGAAFIPDITLWALKTKEKLLKLPEIYKESEFMDESVITREETKSGVSCDMQDREPRSREAMERYLKKLIKETYRPRGIIKTPAFIIKAEENKSPRLNEKDWNKMVKGDVKFIEIPGDHESILAYPWVEKLADEIKKVLKG